MKIVLLPLLLLLGTGTVVAQDTAAAGAPVPDVPDSLVQAREAAIAGDFKKAAAILEDAAQAGNADSAFALGEFYLEGTGVEQSVTAALEWYERAADGGNAMALFRQGELYLTGKRGVAQHTERGRFLLQSAGEAGVADAWMMLGGVLEAEADAADAAPDRKKLFSRAREYYRQAAKGGSKVGQRKLGLMLEEGKGGGKDAAQAISWLKKAALNGDAASMDALGARYKDGNVVEKDAIVALGWLLASAERGFPPGMTNLGLCYEQGFAVPRNYDQAGSWYAKASKQGYAPAQFLLGQLFEHGRGTKLNPVFAFTNYSRAASQGVPAAATARDRIRKNLSPAQLREADKILGTAGAPEGAESP